MTCMEDIEREREREREDWGNIPMEFEGGDRVDEGSAASGERERERERENSTEMEIYEGKKSKKIGKNYINAYVCIS
jgi:hypothetical protein